MFRKGAIALIALIALIGAIMLISTRDVISVNYISKTTWRDRVNLKPLKHEQSSHIHLEGRPKRAHVITGNGHVTDETVGTSQTVSSQVNSYLSSSACKIAVRTRSYKRGIVPDALSSTKFNESQVETEPVSRTQMDWYNGQDQEKNNEANGQLKADTTHKTKKENLKPRKTNRPRVQFIQGNLQKSQTGQIELNKRISHLNKAEENFVCLIQEPYTSHSRIINQPNSVQKFAAKGLARAAIYISKNTTAWFIENLSDKDLVVVQIKIGQQDVLVVSAYMDIKNRTLETPSLTKVLDFASERGLGLIIGIDSNCHSTLFGPKQNQR